MKRVKAELAGGKYELPSFSNVAFIINYSMLYNMIFLKIYL